MRHRRKTQRGRGIMDIAKKGIAATKTSGLSPDAFQNAMSSAAIPTAAPPGIMTSLTNQASAPSQMMLLNNAQKLTPQQVKNAVDLADADARNRAAGGPGLFQGGKPSRKTIRRKRSFGSKRVRKSRVRR